MSFLRKDENIDYVLVLPVTVHDSVQSVSDGDDGARGELAPYRVLYEFIRLKVNGSRRFIKDKDLGLLQQSTSKTYQLSLTDAVNMIGYQCYMY